MMGGEPVERVYELQPDGASPPRWNHYSEAGLAVAVLAAGEEDGVVYVDVRFHGVASTTTKRNQIFLAGGAEIPAAAGQHWAVSAFVRIAAGSWAGDRTIEIGANVNDADGRYSSWFGTVDCRPDADGPAKQSRRRSRIGDAKAAYFQPLLQIAAIAGQPIDVTLRIGRPRAEQLAGVSPASEPPRPQRPNTEQSAARIGEQAIVEGFWADIPLLHYWCNAWNTGGFGANELRELYRVAADFGPATILETGAGNSTLTFLLAKPRRLMSIAIEAELFARIESYCDTRGIDRSALECIVERSELALPRLVDMETPKLDLALIDGGHGWPTVFVDFCYVNALLRRGGILVIDDVQLYSVRELARLLAHDKQRWTLVKSFPKTVFFRKESDEEFLPDFGGQPYIAEKAAIWEPV